jgi:hypothetical protein
VIDDLDPVEAPAPPADQLRRQLARSRAFLRDHRAGLPPASAAVAAVGTVLSGVPPHSFVSGTAPGDRVAAPGDRVADLAVGGGLSRGLSRGRTTAWAAMVPVVLGMVLALDVMAMVWMAWTSYWLDQPDLTAAAALTVFAGVTAMAWERRQRRAEHEHRVARLRADVWPSSASAVPSILLLMLALVGVVFLVVLAVITGVLAAVVAAGVASRLVLAIALMFAAVTPTITRMTTTLFAALPTADGRLDMAGAALPAEDEIADLERSLEWCRALLDEVRADIEAASYDAVRVDIEAAGYDAVRASLLGAVTMTPNIGSTTGQSLSSPGERRAAAGFSAACLSLSRSGRTSAARPRHRPGGVRDDRRRARPDRVRSQRLRPSAGRPAGHSAGAVHTRHRGDALRQRRQGIDRSVRTVLLQG